MQKMGKWTIEKAFWHNFLHFWVIYLKKDNINKDNKNYYFIIILRLLLPQYAPKKKSVAILTCFPGRSQESWKLLSK